ncbi:DUF4132 domain-containing protein [Spirillospora sp. NBC_01491]|uniref:DUF4132 domain-containing protein n=1 Tax=Spirillospora sp. NBC_01491 TaxID=2976007 RepID=UPI002E30379E|nr:DUF4132 domain-containing protein [Spirillospora sp. NBC_01491]
MDTAARLLRLMTGPPFEDPDPHAAWTEMERISDEELGTLVPVAYRVGAKSELPHAVGVRFAVEAAFAERQARFTPEACRAMFDALVAGLTERKWADLARGSAAVVRCTGPLPDVADAARTLVHFMLDNDRVDKMYALFAAAGLADVDAGDGDGAVGETLRAVVERAGRGAGPIALDQFDVIAGLDPFGQALLSEAESAGSYGTPPVLPGLWSRIADLPAYSAFARRALEAAAERARAIQAGEITYRADKAFDTAEVGALGHAARLALCRDEPWLPGLLDRLLHDIAVAPTAAKSLPSQALLYEIVRAGEEFPTPELVTSLRTVRTVVRHAGVPKRLDKMLKRVEAALAERAEVALRLPGLGFGPGGELRRAAGEYEGVVTAADDVRLTWWKDGAPLRSVPAAVRRDHGPLVAELRELVKRVRVQLATLARALEGGFSADGVHPYARWRDELAGHPIAGTVIGRLIWEVETAPGVWSAVLPAAGGLPDAADDAPVRLWHPIRATPEQVGEWRDLIVERRIRQPFKQAFREIYPLTPAEQETRHHSNRFAAHLVRYRTMAALFRARGWKSGFLGPWDGGGEDEAERALGAGEWLVRFRHGLADHTVEDRLASTDRVRFARRADGAWRDAPLADVPPLVFSEAMRDVDLFVGVTSIAADPDWDGSGTARAYWERAAFGELTESAEVRRDALSRLLPGTRIADRCELDGRFLVVRGDLRTYKIHLGSGNILMRPDDSYLCIVPASGGAGGAVFLPFEEDRLTVILSKAFLLAADTKITDRSILAQLHRSA